MGNIWLKSEVVYDVRRIQQEFHNIICTGEMLGKTGIALKNYIIAKGVELLNSLSDLDHIDSVGWSCSYSEKIHNLTLTYIKDDKFHNLRWSSLVLYLANPALLED